MQWLSRSWKYLVQSPGHHFHKSAGAMELVESLKVKSQWQFTSDSDIKQLHSNFIKTSCIWPIMLRV